MAQTQKADSYIYRPLALFLDVFRDSVGVPVGVINAPCRYSSSAVCGARDRYSASTPGRLNRPPSIAEPAPLVGAKAHFGVR